ncbi:MAG: Mini-ribonuclease 3 [Tissierellaceae bacterium]|nr:Mini-ribonuclease 3 [Tissierellaceae bacterium]
MENYNIFREMGKDLSAEDIAMLSPLHLAYIGDAVYELLVRTYLLTKKMPVNQLHKLATKFVKAKSQADIVHDLEDFLTEKEWDIVRKGRNAKSNTMAKNATLIDYKYATGFEALLGYLYVLNMDKRLEEVFEMILKINITKEKGD